MNSPDSHWEDAPGDGGPPTTPSTDRHGGCLQTIIGRLLLGWLVIVPLIIFLLRPSLASTTLEDPFLSIVAAALTLVLHEVVFIPLAFVLRRSRAWVSTRALAVGLALVAGALPFFVLPSALWVRQIGRTEAISLALSLPYLLVVGVVVYARFLGRDGRAVLADIGLLARSQVGAIALALLLGAVLSWPWVVVGSLGSSGATIGALVGAVAVALKDEILYRGLVFGLLAHTTRRGWVAALTGGVFVYAFAQLYPLITGAGPDALATAGGGFLQGILFGLLYTELRVRSNSLRPAILAHFLIVASPLLFADPRSQDELAHLYAHSYAAVAAGLLALVLFAIRQIRQRRAGAGQPLRPWAGAVWATRSLGVLAWAGVIALYLTSGAPGLHEDGLLVFVHGQANLSAIAGYPDRNTRRRLVYDALRQEAETTQAPIRAELDRLGIQYRAYYLMNVIRVDNRPDLVDQLSHLPGVDRVLPLYNVRPYPVRLPFSGLPASPPGGIPWDIQELGANQVWQQGFTGQGVVVAGADTGYQWDHPLLKSAYRGWDGSTAHHDYNWHDAWDDSPVPQDRDGHGTHTMGTIVGDDGNGHRLGMAPGAKWIGCRNMRNGIGNPAAYLECMEWFLAPYPLHGDPFRDGRPDLGPDVINNSWGCPDYEGCQPDTLEQAVDNLRAAGILMVVSAGNDGPACSTIGVPANYAASFAVGATDAPGDTGSPKQNGFTSRGPAGSLTKPDISAPGVDVISSVPPDSYAVAAGTSMAAPHVTGAVALLWSAHPELKGNLDRTTQLLERTATNNQLICDPGLPPQQCSCGNSRPDNVYGWGRVNVAAAVAQAGE